MAKRFPVVQLRNIFRLVIIVSQRNEGFLDFFNIVSVQNYNPVPPPPPPPPQAPPPARLFKPREIPLEKEVDQQATGDIPPLK